MNDFLSSFGFIKNKAMTEVDKIEAKNEKYSIDTSFNEKPIKK